MHTSYGPERVKWSGPAAFYAFVIPLAGSMMIAATCLLASSAARAQAVMASQPNEGNEETPGLNEILVTARKPVETMQSIPESIAAFGAQEISDAHIVKIDDLGNLVSNLNITTRADNTPDVVLRGIGSFGVVSGVGFYANDVQLFDGQSVRTEDIERIEVLKGPQGTLYGGSNVGGAIKYITKLPTDDFQAGTSVEFGNYSTQTYSAFVSGPLVAGLDARASFFDSHTDGYIYENPDADIEPDIDTIGFSRKRKVVTYVSFHTSKRGLQTFDSSTAAIFSSLETKLPGYALDLVSQNEDENKFIVMAWNDRTPGARYVFDSQTGHLKKLADVAPWLNEKELAPVQPISVETSDHLIVHGYLTLPLQGEGKNLPLVVNVHSGPWWRDRWEYIAPESAEVQLLANRGYAVLQLNFRGSIGYGRAFWKAGFKEWGRKMQQDLTDGVKWLIGRGIVDPKRIAIYGKSYGGYAALAGVTFTPELYKAGIDYAGESNMLTYMEKFPPSTKSEMPEYYAKVGNPVTETSFLAAVSPALHAEKIKAPLFIAHGDQDPIVSRTESDQMVAALHGVDVEYMVKAKEGHIFQNEENKIDFYTAIEAFLAKHLRKDASPLTDGQTGAIGE